MHFFHILSDTFFFSINAYHCNVHFFHFLLKSHIWSSFSFQHLFLLTPFVNFSVIWLFLFLHFRFYLACSSTLFFPVRDSKCIYIYHFIQGMVPYNLSLFPNFSENAILSECFASLRSFVCSFLVSFVSALSCPPDLWLPTLICFFSHEKHHWYGLCFLKYS